MGKQWKQWETLFWGAPESLQILTAACSLEGKLDQPVKDSILKSRDITLPTKVHQVKAMVFPVVMYGCESWTIKKAEHWRIDTFELCCWRRLLRVPGLQGVNPKGNQSWIVIGRTNAEAEAPIFWPPDGEESTHWKRPWCWERLKAGREGDNRR